MVRLVLVLVLVFSAISTMAIENKYTFENIYPKAKRSLGTLKTIIEDKNGFMWFGSSNGLYYYNSREIIKQQFNTKQIGHTYAIDVNILLQDAYNNIWAGTENGLCKYNYNSNQFDWITFNKEIDDYTQLKITNFIHWEQQKYIILSEGNVYIYQADQNTLTPYPIIDKKFPGRISLLEKMDDNTLLIGMNSGFIFTLNNLESKPKKLYHAKRKAIKTICANNGIFFIGYHDHGVGVVDKNGHHLYEFTENTKGKNYLPSNMVRKIIKRDNGEIWIATLDGILVVDGDKRTIIRSSIHNRLPNNIVNTLYKDSKDDIWMGNRGSGIGFFSAINYSFTHYQNINAKYNFTNSMVSSFCETSNGTIWIGSENHGMAQYFTEKDSLVPFSDLSDKPLNIKTLGNSNDNDLKIWVGAFKKGIWEIDLSTKRLKIHNSLNDDNIKAIIYSISISNNTIWIGTRRQGIYKYNYITKAFSHYDLSKLNAGIRESNWVWKTYLDKKNNLWVGTESGLYLKKAENNKFEKVAIAKTSNRETTQNKFFSICEDNYGKIWLGTNGSGILIYNPKKKGYEDFKDKHIISTEQIYSILTDHSNTIWFTSSKGIFRHNPESGLSHQFSFEDGLSGGEYIPNSAFVSSKGYLYFGSSKGFSVIKPKTILLNQRLPKVYLSKILINNNPFEKDSDLIANTKHLADIKTLQLKHWQNALTFSFVSNNFIKPSKNKFKYRLINYQDKWNELLANGTISFSKIPAGSYTLEVKGTNNDGVWSESSLQLKIYIAPPLWLSWYAYAIYLLGSALLLIFISKELKIRIRLKNEVVAERFKNDANETLHKEKQRFFMNISHEFRTPLTLVLSPLNSLLQKYQYDDKTVKHLSLIKRNADRLLRLTNQILDFNLIEVGKVKGKFEKIDVVDLCKSVYQHFEFQLNEKEISFTLDSKFKSFVVQVDPDMIEKILFNLISNALKFSNEKGEVHISIDKKEITETDYSECTYVGVLFSGESLELSVTDNGKGVDEKLLPTIFERFTTDTNQQTSGAGIGLHLSGEYARINNASIRVFSQAGKGSSFILNIPLNKDLYREKTPISLHTLGSIAEDFPLPSMEKKGGTLTKKVVLLAEDNMELRNHLKEVLNTRYKVVTAKNGKLAHEIANEIIPDIIITDLSMPGMNGLELIKSLKDTKKTKQIPIIVLTAHKQSSSQKESIIQGADSFLTKPIDNTILIAQIENIFKNRRVLEEKVIALDKVSPNESSYDKKDIIKMAEKIIEANFHNMQFSVDQLAQELKQSRSNVHRLIKAKTNQNTSEFIRDVRLKKAIELLKENNMSMEEIAHYVGFNSISYFSRSFKKKYGQSPTEYVRTMKK